MNAYEIDDLCPVCEKPLYQATSHSIEVRGVIVFFCGRDCCPVCSASEHAFATIGATKEVVRRSATCPDPATPNGAE